MAFWAYLVALLVPENVAALRCTATVRNGTAANDLKHAKQAATFQSFYWGHETGRGIWKWNNALDAYQRHLAPFAGKSLALVEVGVQSGGSIEMWKGVLGPNLHYYGIDINVACKQFADATTTITIGDQADENMWTSFYSTVRNTVDIIVDDGGHEAHQMGVTFHLAFEHINPGGFIITEDLNEAHVPTFLFNAANSIGWWNSIRQVESVHLYPVLFILRKPSPENAGSFVASLPPLAITVDSFPAMWAEIPKHPGKTIAVKNPLWGSFLTEASLRSVFTQFSGLYAGQYTDHPRGCSTTSAPICTGTLVNSPVQASVISVHAYQDTLFVEVASQPPVIEAVRRGTVWIPYGGS